MAIFPKSKMAAVRHFGIVMTSFRATVTSSNSIQDSKWLNNMYTDITPLSLNANEKKECSI